TPAGRFARRRAVIRDGHLAPRRTQGAESSMLTLDGPPCLGATHERYREQNHYYRSQDPRRHGLPSFARSCCVGSKRMLEPPSSATTVGPLRGLGKAIRFCQLATRTTRSPSSVRRTWIAASPCTSVACASRSACAAASAAWSS